MTKLELIQYWRNMAERDWKAVGDLAASKNNVHALFFAHLVIEKLMKAHWIQDNSTESTPPRVHNLEYLLSQTRLTMSAENIDELRIMNAWNIEGRYQDYRDLLFATTTDEYTAEKLQKVNQIRLWLLNQLP